LTGFAEAAKNPHFKNHRLIYDASEEGALMNLEKFFGSKMVKRLEMPGADGYSQTIEDFYYNVDDAIKKNKPFIYVLDSMDSLTSTYSDKKFNENKVKHRKGEKGKGSYGDGKAKINSESIRRLIPILRKTKSILIVISQTRDNIDAGLFEPKKTRAGGRSLEFYATLEIWSSIRGPIKKQVRGKKRQIGIIASVRVKKNRVTGRNRTVKIPIYNSFGFDDIGACIDYLVDEGYWKAKGGRIQAEEFETEGTREQLVSFIEETNQEKPLRLLVGELWLEIESALEVKRKKRYE